MVPTKPITFHKMHRRGRSTKNQIFKTVQPVLLYPLVNQFTGFGQVTVLQMLQNLFNSYGAIEEIDLEGNRLKMMGPYDPTELQSRLIDKL